MSDTPTPSEMQAFNEAIIAEFRANAGVLGGGFTGAPMLLLTTKGKRSGADRIAPLVYLADGERYVIFGSRGGSPAHPDWYHNMVANGVAHVEVGTDRFDAVITIVEGDERDALYARQEAAMPVFTQYKAKAGDRQIPVVILTRP